MFGGTYLRFHLFKNAKYLEISIELLPEIKDEILLIVLRNFGSKEVIDKSPEIKAYILNKLLTCPDFFKRAVAIEEYDAQDIAEVFPECYLEFEFMKVIVKEDIDALLHCRDFVEKIKYDEIDEVTYKNLKSNSDFLKGILGSADLKLKNNEFSKCFNGLYELVIKKIIQTTGYSSDLGHNSMFKSKSNNNIAMQVWNREKTSNLSISEKPLMPDELRPESQPEVNTATTNNVNFRM